MSPRTLRIVVLTYLVKTLLLGVAWLVVPDLPQRAAEKARHLFARARE
jgi:hypothetical protein